MAVKLADSFADGRRGVVFPVAPVSNFFAEGGGGDLFETGAEGHGVDVRGHVRGRAILAVAGGDQELVFSELLVDRFDAIVFPGDDSFGSVAAADDVDFFEGREAATAFADHFDEETAFGDGGFHAGIVDRHADEIEPVLESDLIVGFMGK